MQRTFVIGVRVAVSLALALLVAPRALRAQSGKAAVVIPAGELKWMDNAAVKGARLAVLWGDPKTGGYGAIKKVPAGFKFGAHTHTSDQQVIVISGSLNVIIEDGPSRAFGPGSYASIPGGKVHTADCAAGAECVYFEQQPGASDLKPVVKK